MRRFWNTPLERVVPGWETALETVLNGFLDEARPYLVEDLLNWEAPESR